MTLRELAKESERLKFEKERREAQDQVIAILDFCRPFAEKGQSSCQYRGLISVATQDFLRGDPERLQLRDDGDGLTSSWHISWE